jgi:uncharacterized protein (DUF1810 family)
MRLAISSRGGCCLSSACRPRTPSQGVPALVNAVDSRAIREILGSPDDLKFRSSMTLFGAVSSDPEFAAAISQFYGGRPDQATLDVLGR